MKGVVPAGDSKDFQVGIGNMFNINLYGDTILARNNFQYRGTMSWQRGRSSLRFGYSIIRRQFNIPRANTGYHGTLSFTANYTNLSAADVIIGKANGFTETDGFHVNVRSTDYSFFAQDDFKLNRRVTFNIGLRYEPFRPWTDEWTTLPQVMQWIPGQQSTVFVNAPKGVLFYGDPGVAKSIMPYANNRFAPRIGLAIDPTGRGKSSIRMGYGVFWDQTYGSVSIQNIAASTPVFTTAFTSTNLSSLADPYQGRPSPYPPVYPRAKDYVFPSKLTPAIFANDATNPYYQQWNISAEHLVASMKAVLRASYQGSKGTHVGVLTQGNPAIYSAGATTTSTDARRIYTNINSVILARSAATSNYHGATFTFDKKFSKTYSVLASYTWSKNIDWGDANISTTGGTQAQNPNCWSCERAPSSSDRTHVVNISHVKDLPRLDHKPLLLRTLMGGWQSSGIISIYSGIPLTVRSGTDRSLTGANQDRANLIGVSDIAGDRSKGEQVQRWFNTAAYAPADLGTFGNLGRNTLRGPGAWNIDLGVFKQLKVWEAHRLQFRGELFNVLNHANLGNPNTVFSTSQFGKITSASSPRVIQLALKYEF